MQPEYFPYESPLELPRVHVLCAWYKMRHFCKSIDNDKDSICSFQLW